MSQTINSHVSKEVAQQIIKKSKTRATTNTIGTTKSNLISETGVDPSRGHLRPVDYATLVNSRISFFGSRLNMIRT